MEKLRVITVDSFFMNTAINECTKIKSEIEELETLRDNKISEADAKKAEITAIETEVLSIEENIKILKTNKVNLMEKVEEIKRKN
jgi:predicted  nucleic acid-binding Zn-ribbon protein